MAMTGSLAREAGGRAGPASGDDELEAAYAAAEAALRDIRSWRLQPTASTYEVWFAYRFGSDAGVRGRVDDMIRSGRPITETAIASLHAELLDRAGVPQADQTDRHLHFSERLGAAASALVVHAASSRVAIRCFGEALRQGAARLAPGTNEEERVSAMAALAHETFGAAERNRLLEQQLAATTAQVEELRESLAAQSRAASTDELTGLGNRRAFADRLRDAIARASNGVDGTFSLLLLDVDHFKRFNDMHGHRTGDLVLKLLGRLLIDSIKGRDMAARYGGEEFTVLLMGADICAAAKVARQIGAALANKRLKLADLNAQGSCRVTASIGVAQYRLEDTPSSLLDRADAAMYVAKRAGRNRVVTESEIPAGAF